MNHVFESLRAWSLKSLHSWAALKLCFIAYSVSPWDILSSFVINAFVAFQKTHLYRTRKENTMHIHTGAAQEVKKIGRASFSLGIPEE